MNKILSNKKAIAVFVLPTVILFTLILFVPVIQMIGYSFTDYNALSKPSFCGLKNYRTMMKDDVLLTALKNSIFFLLFSVVTQQIIGILLAVLLTNIKKGRNTFKNIIYLPCVLSSAALGLLWAFMFNPRMGINQFLAVFGIKGPLWLMDTKGFIILPMWVIAFVALWQYVGQNMMLYMAQITGISQDLYAADQTDAGDNAVSQLHRLSEVF